MPARMEESRSELFERAHALAGLLHPGPELSFRIALEAVARLEVTARRQTRRRSYLPVGRRRAGGGTSPGSRYRVSLERRQLLQLLVLISSEPLEREQERGPPAARPDGGEMAVRFVAYLVRICLRRNSFHTALGIGRLLHDYSTEEVMGLYDLLRQDPDRFPDGDYLRERKRVLLEQLRQRFGDLVRTCRGRHGEERLEAQEATPALVVRVRRILDACTPWGSECVLPERFDPLAEEIPALCSGAGHPDREHPVEVRRIHSVLHPPCLVRLAGALGLDPPDRRLTVPRFFHVREGDGAGEPGERSPAPSGSEHAAMHGELQRRAAQRESLGDVWLAVRVDGVEALRWDPACRPGARISIDPEAERIEVWAIEAGDEVLLALHLVATGAPASVRLQGGRSIDFALAPEPGGGDLALEVRYREAHTARAAATWLRRLAQRLGRPGSSRPLPHRAGGGLAVLAGAAAALVLLLGAGLYLQRTGRSDPPAAVRGPQLASVPLSRIESVYVERPEAGTSGGRLQALLAAELEAREGWRAAATAAAAQAVLAADGGEDERSGRWTLRLVNRRGEVLWHGTFEGDAREIAAAAASSLDRARARSR